MSKIIIAIIIMIIVAGLGYWVYQSILVPEEEVVSEGSKDCANNDDCVVFGETGDCNCGCYNRNNFPSGTGGECFCAAPNFCKCVNSKCEGVFEEEVIAEEKDEKCSWEISREELEELGLHCSMIAGYYYGPAIVGTPSEEYDCNPVPGCEYDPEIVPFETKEECQSVCG